MAYPAKGIELVVPSNAELPFTGWGANFTRRGHEYAVALRDQTRSGGSFFYPA